MRILMLSWEFPPQKVGGLSQHVFELSLALVQRGYEVDVITAGGEEMPPRETMEGIGVWRVVTPGGNPRDFIDWVHLFNFALLEKGAQLCNYKGKYALIHAHDWLVAFAARGIKHVYTTPLVATVHATEFGRHNGLHNDDQRYISSVEWQLTYEAWKVICCSRYMREELKTLFQLPEDKLVVIPNAIRPECCAPGGEKNLFKKHNSGKSGKEIFFVGRLVPEKGVQVILKAAPEILSRFPESRFIIAGRGPFEDYLKNRVWEMGLEDKIHFCGYVDDLTRNELYRRADIAVFPSLYEPFGIVALEAMVSGTPVVVSSTGGLDEIIDHEVDGLKSYPNDPRSLAEQICRLLGDEKLALTLAKKAYQKALNTYSWERVVRKTEEVYWEIVTSPENSRWQEDAEKQYRWGEIQVERGRETSVVPHLI